MSPAVMWDFRSLWQLAPVAAIFVSMDAAWKRLYTLVKRIPKGRVITYGQLARATRLPGGARAAGRAMAASPRGHAIPWHRVVAAGGRIAVREPFASLQRRLLESEGARLVEGRVSLAECSWAPRALQNRAAPCGKNPGAAPTRGAACNQRATLQYAFRGFLLLRNVL